MFRWKTEWLKGYEKKHVRRLQCKHWVNKAKVLLILTDEKNPKTNKKLGANFVSRQLDMRRKRKSTTALLSPPKRTETNTNTVTARWTGGGSRHVWVGKKGRGQTLPDSLTAGRGEAMPWDKVEAAEKGSRAFSLSPIGGRRSRAEGGSQSVMNSLCFFVVQLPVCSICFSPFVEGATLIQCSVSCSLQKWGCLQEPGGYNS